MVDEATIAVFPRFAAHSHAVYGVVRIPKDRKGVLTSFMDLALTFVIFNFL